MDTLRDMRLLDELWESGQAPWTGAGERRPFWRDRPRSSRRHRARRRVARRRRWSTGADVVCLVRDWVPADASCPQRHRPDGVTVVDGRRPRPGAARARARRVRGRHRLPPRGPDDRRPSRTAIPSRRSRRTSRGTWALLEACRRSPTRRADRRGVVGQGVRRQRRCPTTRTRRSRGGTLRRQQVVRRPDRAGLRRHLRPAGRDHALRQLLRRRRPELEPDRARHDPLGAARRAPGHPLRRHATSATTSTSRTAPPPTCCWPRAGRESPTCAARRSTSPTRPQ